MRNFTGENVIVVAEALRNLARQVEPPFCLPAIIGAAWPDAVVTGRDLPDGVDEVVAVTEDGVIVIYRRDMSLADQRFAIAHAAAHLLYDLGSSQESGVVLDADSESRADAFAFELLAPNRLLMQRIVFWPEDGEDADIYADQVDRIASHFHLPAALVDQRIRELQRQAIQQGEIDLTQSPSGHMMAACSTPRSPAASTLPSAASRR